MQRASERNSYRAAFAAQILSESKYKTKGVENQNRTFIAAGGWFGECDLRSAGQVGLLKTP